MKTPSKFLLFITAAVLWLSTASPSFAATPVAGSNYDNSVSAPANKGISDKAASYGTPLKTEKDASGREYYTEDSIKAYQKKAGINSDGMIGSETRGVAGKAGASNALNTDGTMASPSWTFSAGAFSPSKKEYSGGPKENVRMILQKIADILLTAISALAVLFIAVAGFRMAASSGNSDEATKGKTMVKSNLLAIVAALCAYAIVNFVSWLLSA